MTKQAGPSLHQLLMQLFAVLLFSRTSINAWPTSGRGDSLRTSLQNGMKSHPSYTINSLTQFQLYNQNNKQGDDSQPESYDVAPEGFLSSDFRSVGDGKKVRVLLYIALSLIPCLFLVPFFLSRDFVPPGDLPPM